MNVVGLFAGIGGLELGLHRAGHSTLHVCEILPAAQQVLKHRFPGVELSTDVRALPGLPKQTELLCAGFPCQDLSQAGKTLGLSGTRSALVAEVFRLLRSIPSGVPWVILENVPFMLQLHGGLAMRAIIDEFERLGYRWAYRVVDSFGFGVPQRRERVYLVASLHGKPQDVLLSDDSPIARPTTAIGVKAHGFYWTEGLSGLGWAPDAVPTLKNGSTIGIPSPPAVLLPDGKLVKPDIRDAERLQGFEPVFGEAWTVAAESVARPSVRWSLVGSAVTVSVAEWLGRRLHAPESYVGHAEEPFPMAGKLPKAAWFDGTERRASKVTVDPLGIKPLPLVSFLEYPGDALSLKAAAGFLERTRRAKLRFDPKFIEAVESYVTSLGGVLPPLRGTRDLPLSPALA